MEKSLKGSIKLVILWFGSDACHLFTLEDRPREDLGWAGLWEQVGGKRNSLGSWKVLTQMAVSDHPSQIPETLLFHCVKEVEVNYITVCCVQSDPHLDLKLSQKVQSADCGRFSGPVTALGNVARACHVKKIRWESPICWALAAANRTEIPAPLPFEPPADGRISRNTLCIFPHQTIK